VIYPSCMSAVSGNGWSGKLAATLPKGRRGRLSMQRTQRKAWRSSSAKPSGARYVLHCAALANVGRKVVTLDNAPETTQPQTELHTDEPEAISFAEFLESVAPSQTRKITGIARLKFRPSGGGRYYELLVPEILLHCGHSACNGTRFFRFIENRGTPRPTLAIDNDTLFYIHYRCSNCRSTLKIFSLMAKVDDEDSSNINEDGDRLHSGECYKIGELPIYGPPTPSRLISLIGPDRETFLKGRRCENQGLGIGAFVYYRRVVENQKSRILGEIIKVSEKIGAPPEVTATLTNAMTEIQFNKALESVRDALPQILLVNGRNPLTLLHSALSEGLHAQTDEHCLEIAHAVRVVLTELSDRLGQALRDEAELKNAISRLTRN
jgi:hypothetical protein